MDMFIPVKVLGVGLIAFLNKILQLYFCSFSLIYFIYSFYIRFTDSNDNGIPNGPYLYYRNVPFILNFISFVVVDLKKNHKQST